MATLSIDDILSLEYPGTPSWSSDGRYVATVIQERDTDTVLFSDRTGDSKWRYRPGDQDTVSAATWRPGVTECLVTSGSGRVTLVDPQSESAHTVATGAEAHHTWAPGGDRIAFFHSGAPCVRDIEDGAMHTFDVPDGNRFRADGRMLSWAPDGDLLAYRFTREDAKHVGVIDVASGTLVWRTTGPGSSHSPIWISNDALLFERIRNNRKSRELVRVTPQAGTETVLFQEEDTRAGVFLRGPPILSPDRSRLAFPLPLDGWPHLYLLDAETGSLEQVTQGAFEDTGTVNDSPRWLDDQTLVFSTNRNGLEERDIYRVNTATGEVDPVVQSAGTNVFPRPSPDGSQIAYIHADRERSPELRLRSVAPDQDQGVAAVRLTKSNVSDWPIEPFVPERISIDVTDDVTVPAFLIDPHRDEPTDDGPDSVPGFVWVHGGPMRQMRDGWHPTRAYSIIYAIHQFLADKGIVGLLVNYRGGTGYGQEFRQAIAGAQGHKVAADVSAAGEYLASLDHVDGDAIGVWGLSYGGYATLRLLGTHPDAFELGVSIAGVADRRPYADWTTAVKRPEPEFRLPTLFGGSRWDAPDAWATESPITTVDQYEAPLYTFHGTGDDDVHVEQQDHLVNALLETDAEFEAEYYPGEGHVFRSGDVWARTIEKISFAIESELR